MSSFSKNDTTVAKGVALILMLIHHLFEPHPEIGKQLFGYSISQFIGINAKVCVAIFVILSGYGLSKSIKKSIGLKTFYFKRFSKIYFNYWFIWLVFVPVGILFFNRGISEVYGANGIIKMVINFFGLHLFFGYYGYNAVWWYISLLIILYLLFPFIEVLVEKFGWYFLLLTIGFMFIYIAPIVLKNQIISFNFIQPWIFPFSLGIYLSQNDGFTRLKKTMKNFPHFKGCLYLLLLSLTILQRHKGILFTGVNIDAFFGLLIIMIGYEYISNSKILNYCILLIGKHSFNIFLFHTFIFYYFSSFIYWSDSPVLIFFTLLFSCLAISVLLENLKDFIKFNSFQLWVTDINFKEKIYIS